MMMGMTAMDGVLVKMANGDNETFKAATSFRTDLRWRADDSGSWLSVLRDDVELGCFPPGAWIGVRFFEGYAPPSPANEAVGTLQAAQRAIDGLRGKTVTINLHTPDDPDDGIKVAA